MRTSTASGRQIYPRVVLQRLFKRGGIAEQRSPLADVGLRAAHIARAKVAADDGMFITDTMFGQSVAQRLEEFDEAGAPTDCDIVDVVARPWGCGDGERVGLHGVIDEAVYSSVGIGILRFKRCLDTLPPYRVPGMAKK